MELKELAKLLGENWRCKIVTEPFSIILVYETDIQKCSITELVDTLQDLIKDIRSILLHLNKVYNCDITIKLTEGELAENITGSALYLKITIDDIGDDITYNSVNITELLNELNEFGSVVITNIDPLSILIQLYSSEFNNNNSVFQLYEILKSLNSDKIYLDQISFSRSNNTVYAVYKSMEKYPISGLGDP